MEEVDMWQIGLLLKIAGSWFDTKRHFEESKELFLDFIDPFVPSAPFLYLLKTLGNLIVFYCFQGVEKGCLGTNGLMNVVA